MEDFNTNPVKMQFQPHRLADLQTPAMTRMGLGMPQWDLANNFLRNQNPHDGLCGPSFPDQQTSKIAELNRQHAMTVDAEKEFNRDRARCETQYDQALVAKREAILHRDGAAVRLKQARKEFALREAERDACDQRLDESESILLWCNNAEGAAIHNHQQSAMAAIAARHDCAAEIREDAPGNHSQQVMARLCSRYDHRATYSDAASIYRMEDRRLRERDSLVCGQFLEMASQRCTKAEAVLNQMELQYHEADAKAEATIAHALGTSQELAEARCAEDATVQRQQELREESRGAGLAYGGLQGYSFPQVQQYNEYLRPLSRVHMCPEPVLSTMAV